MVNRNGRRYAVNSVHCRLVHTVKELASVGRKRLHIAPLAFGVNGIERERGLTRTTHPGDHHQLTKRQIQIDVLQIVLPRATYADDRVAFTHSGKISR